jgi:hypothetical protein
VAEFGEVMVGNLHATALVAAHVSAEVNAAQQSWSSCMLSSGYEYATFDEAALVRLTLAERDAARQREVDVECTERSGLGELFAQRYDEEVERLVEANSSMLREYLELRAAAITTALSSG